MYCSYIHYFIQLNVCYLRLFVFLLQDKQGTADQIYCLVSFVCFVYTLQGNVMWPSLDVDNHMVMILKNILMWSNTSNMCSSMATLPFGFYKNKTRLSSGVVPVALEIAGIIYCIQATAKRDRYQSGSNLLHYKTLQGILPSLDVDNHMMMILKNNLMWSNMSSRCGHITFRVL